METPQGQEKNRMSMIWENVRRWKEVHQPLSPQPTCVFCNSFYDLSTLLSWSLEQASWVINGTRQILKFNNIICNHFSSTLTEFSKFPIV